MAKRKNGVTKAVAGLGLVIVVVVGIVGVVVFLPVMFPPDNLDVNESTTLNTILEQYDALVQRLLGGEEFENLEVPIQEMITDMAEDLNEELEKELMTNQLNQTEPIVVDDTIESEICTGDCIGSLEVIDPCEQGFIFTDNLGCIPETLEGLAEILDFDPFDPATQFKVFSTVTLIDSNGQEFENVNELDIPLTSLITREGKILDLGRIEVRLVGQSDSNNPIETEGILDFEINGQSQRQFNLRQVASPNPITSAFDIRIGGRSIESFSFEGLEGLETGDFANTLKVNLRNFVVIQGNSTFSTPQDVTVYELQFDLDEGLRTVTGSTGVVQAIPIADGKIQICANAVQLLVNGVQVDFQPDVPKSVSVKVRNAEGDFVTVITPFTVTMNLQPFIGGTTYNLPTFCEKPPAGIPRSSNVQIIVSGINCGTGAGCIDKPEQVFQKLTPESGGVNYKIDCFVSGIETAKHWCTSNFGYSHSRN